MRSMRLVRQLTRMLSLLALLGLVAFLYIGLQGEAWASTGASAPLRSTSNTDLTGEVRFSLTATGLQIDAQIRNAPPGYHGFHIHETPSCEQGGTGAGGHYNPDGVKHGRLVSEGFDNAHVGDLGNFVVGLDGQGDYHQVIPGLALTGGNHAIANRAVILHEMIDTYAQPTGNAGGRIGCGVIQLQ